MHFENVTFLENYLQEESTPPAAVSMSQEAPEAYRLWGHMQALFMPDWVKKKRVSHPLAQIAETLDPETRKRLEKIYCGPIGFEFIPFCSDVVQQWLISVIESTKGLYSVSAEKKIFLLQGLIQAELFEAFLHTKYAGQKRFSLEGAEVLIPMLSCLLEMGAEQGIEEVIIGMSHRGRLNVLANIVGKPYKDILLEFEDVSPEHIKRSGDVRYHKGYSSTATLSSGKAIDIRVLDNPSHLESVDPVVEGFVRAHQDKKRNSFPLLLHGDAAISGQGVVYETLQLSGLEGYTTKGTVHIVINNHIGFTVLPESGRSSYYCTDIAKAFGFPIFHVNADDPESCIWAIERAFEIRQRFGIDVFIDLNCRRKYGHNEGDEPAFTQPTIYQTIRKRPSILSLYSKKLIDEKSVEQKQVDEMKDAFYQVLQKAFDEAKEGHAVEEKEDNGRNEVDTSIDEKVLEKIALEISKIPDNFIVHPKVHHAISTRAKKLTDGFLDFAVDWSFAETLALGSILWSGMSVRFTGQDVRRGTFSQRHGVWIDQETEKEYFPLQAIARDPKQFELIDSPLIEYAALGFEYGYSLASQDGVVIWEAQFGDFVNGAQIIIDQYLAAGEQKWGVYTGLVMLLPHGYEGQGPEHSSGRIERFLSLCGDDNMTVANPTTPAQIFHLLRRQAKEKSFKRPLIIFTPKSLLRNPKALSPMRNLVEGSFQEVIDDEPKYRSATRLIFCQGKVFYDLDAERNRLDVNSTAIIRVEQLYPLNKKKMEEIIGQYSLADQFFWVQEEPYNMGAWSFLHDQIAELLPRKQKLEYRGRAASGSPAVGYHQIHDQESRRIMQSVVF